MLELVLHRPERYNAIDSDVRDALIDAFDGAPDRAARVIALRGEGKGSCAGADLKESGARVAGVHLERRMATSSYRLGQVIEANEALTLGTIARVVPATELVDAARASARELASLPADAVTYTKQLLNRSFELDLESLLFAERAIQALLSTREPDVD